jgi:hypothetical protein
VEMDLGYVSNMDSEWRLVEAESPDQMFAAAPVMRHTRFRVGMARVGVDRVVHRHWMGQHLCRRPTRMQKPCGSHTMRVNGLLERRPCLVTL